MASNAATWASVPHSYFRWFYKRKAVGDILQVVDTPLQLISMLERALKNETSHGSHAEAIWMVRNLFQINKPVASGTIQLIIPKLMHWFDTLARSQCLRYVIV